MRNGKYLSAAILVMATLVSQRAYSTDVYHWVDDDGVVHFSDTRPNDDADVKTLQVDAANPPGYDPAEDPYSIANQAKRMNEKWSALAKEREQRRKARRERTPAYVQYRPPRNDGWRHTYWPGFYTAPHSVRTPARQIPTIRRQVNSLDTLNLSGPRPHSINSGAHRARVQRSKDAVSALTRPMPRRR